MLDRVSNPVTTQVSARQAWLGILARATAAEIEACLADAPALPGFIRLREPEIGMAMLRGRLGGGGGAFNFGEITMARCSIRDADGFVGHGFATGRDAAQVELIARLDAALQNPATTQAFDRAVVAPLAAAQAARRRSTAAQAAATKVEFFTLATMRT